MGEIRDAVTERHLERSAALLAVDVRRADPRPYQQRLADRRAEHDARLNPEPAQPAEIEGEDDE